MVDWLEELLALLEEQDEEQKDVLALRLGAEVPAPPGLEREAGMALELEHGKGESDAALEREEAPAEAEGLEWLPEVRAAALEGRNERLETGGAEVGAVEYGAVETGPAGAWWREAAAAVIGLGGAEALKRPKALDAEQAELGGGVERTAVSAAADAAASVQRGLEDLYRQTARAGRTVAGRLPVEQTVAVRTVAQEQAAGFTVDELDRAVRRDSRRYDGGMTIF